MKKHLLILGLMATVLVSGLLCYDLTQENPKSEARKLPRAQRKKARSEYFLNKLKDPKTNKLPENVRAREMAFASSMKPRLKSFANQVTDTHNWAELGPSDVGGRTRALALDTRNSNIVLAAGVSGGIWKSSDGGTTWTPKLPNGSNLSISFLAQDPVNEDVWYATTGEVSNNTASGKGSTANFNGAGIYKSIDNGESWSLMTYVFDGSSSFIMESTANTNIVSNSDISPFKLTSKILLHDFNGTTAVFICSYFYGIWMSVDGGNSFQRFAGNLTNLEFPLYTDIIIDENNAITLWFGPTSSGNNGFFRSLDGGSTFSNLTPPDYTVAGKGARCILALAPSQQSIVYAFAYDNPGTGEKHHFYIFDYAGFDAGGSATFANRSANLPNFDRSIFGDGEQEKFTTQNGYDMALAVHPSNPNFVVLGYVDLIKSENGFTSNPNSDPAKYWIGGNESPYRQDENLDFGKDHHSDQHVLFFDPNNPNVLWSGHDGGISKTFDVTAERVIWESKNNDYNVTQYYTVSIARDAIGTEVIGGTQDNGTPLLDAANFSGELVSSLVDLSSGDGAFCFLGSDISYVSTQNGNVYVIGNGYLTTTKREVNLLFIHPFAADPNDEGTLFYTSFGDGILSRNTNIDEAVEQNDPGLVESGWEDLNISISLEMSAIKVSDQNPSHKLYFGGLLNNSPVLVSWENANTSTDVSEMIGMDLPGVSPGSWLNDIAINPTDGNEIILVYSNYNITGLFHSTDGGQTLTAIEGNLGVNDDQGASGFTGPSMRAAEIVVDWQGNEKYYVATSIGLYNTELLDGDNTQWTLETGLLNNVVIEDLDSRPSDNTIVAGTHGRGIFIGQKINLAPVVENQSFELNENTDNETTVAQVDFVDPENDDVNFTFTEGNIDEAFTIDSQGIIKVGNKDVIDFETNPNFSLAVSINDGELTSTAIISISLINQNDAPEITDQTFSVDENSEVSTEVEMVVATDQDQDVLTYSITGGNIDELFEIDENTGLITIKAADLDHESTNSYSLTIKVSDTELESTANIVVNVNDVNEAPEIMDQQITIEEKLEVGAKVGMVEVSDPENDQLTYTIKNGNTEGAFALNGNTGELTVSNTDVLDFEVNPTFSLAIEVSDGELTNEAIVTIDLTEIVLSIESEVASTIKVYPNPASTYLQVSLSSHQKEDLSIELINMLGQQQKLFQDRFAGDFDQRFDLSSSLKGYYILRIKYSDFTDERKLLIR